MVGITICFSIEFIHPSYYECHIDHQFGCAEYFLYYHCIRYSVIVEVVPETLRSTVALEAFYEDLGFDVYSAVMVPDVFTLEEILALRERTAGQLQKVLNAIHRGSTKAYRGWWDLCGTDARLELEQLKDKYDTLTTKANTERTAVKRAIECLETMDSNIISRMKEKINTALDKSSPGRFLNPVHLEHSSAGHVFTPTDDKDEDDDNNNKLSAALIAKNVVKEQLFSLTLGFRAALGATEEISESVYRLTLGERMGSTAFVTFHSLLDATTACQVRMVQNAQNFITSPAPEPQDIIWRNIAKPLQQVYNRCRLANCAFALLAIFWTLPVTFVQAISSLEQLQVFIPALKHLKAGSILYNVLSSYLPVMALLGLMLLLPVLFRVSNFYYEGVKLSSAIEQSILTRYFFFSFVNIFVTVSSGSVFSALGDILESPRQLLDILGHTFPNISFYMINLIATQAFIGLPFELSQIGPIFGGLACGSVTAIEFPYGVRYSAMLFVLLIAMMYSVIAPLVSVAAALFFSMALCTYKFLLLRCYHTPYEGGAIAWGRIYQKIIICMVCSQLTLAGYCGLRGGYLQIPCLLILPVVTYFSYDYNNTRYTAPSSRISRELASEVDKLKEQENEDVMKEFHIEAYAPPCIISPIEEIIVEEVDVAVRGDGRHYTRLDT